MPLDLTNLAPETVTLPKSARGRKASPLPENIVKMVQESYNLPTGEGYNLVIPRGKDDSKGVSENVKALTAVLRRAATSLGHGLTISTEDKGKTQVVVIFRAKDKSKRRTKAERYAAEVEDFEAIFGAEDFETDAETVEEYAAETEQDVTEAMAEAWDNIFPPEDDTETTE